jgi:hypothetical protein
MLHTMDRSGCKDIDRVIRTGGSSQIRCSCAC